MSTFLHAIRSLIPCQTALKEEGSMAMETAFRLLGKVAMQELTTNQDVAASMAGFEKYLDQEKSSILNNIVIA